MKEPMLEPHKITLMGDPIPRYEGKRGKFVAFAKRPEVQALAVMAAYQIMDASNSGFSSTSLVFAAVYTGFAILDVLEDRRSDKRLLQCELKGSSKLKSVCINQKPQEQKDNNEAWRIAAGVIKRASKLKTGGYILVIAGVACFSSEPLCFLSVFAPSIVRKLISVKRWHNVAIGDWVVEEKPKPQKKPMPILTVNKIAPALTS